MPDLSEEDVREVALRLREQYPDDEDFEDAMMRLADELEGGGDADPPD